MALRPDRASSYNNVLTSGRRRRRQRRGERHRRRGHGPRRGRPPRAHEPLRLRPDARRSKAIPEYARRSAVRYGRARDLLATQPLGSITAASMRTMLSDHEDAPDTRSAVIPSDGTPKREDRVLVRRRRHRRRITFGRGNPCDSDAQRYSFDDA